MKLGLLSVEIENFKSFVKPAVFIIAAGVGVHLLRGWNNDDLESNGAGKSTVWDAVCWCLFGATVDGLKNPGIQPWKGTKNTRVAVVVSIDGARHTVRRTVSPNKLTIDDRGVAQEQVNDLLRMNMPVFLNTILLGQDQPLFFDRSPSEKMELLSTVLMLDRWDARSEHAGSVAREIAAELSVLDGELLALGTLETALRKDTERTSEQMKEFDRTRDGQIQAERKKLSEFEKRAVRVGKLRDAADMAQEAAGMELAPTRKMLRAADDERRSLAMSLAKQEAEVSLAKKQLARLKTAKASSRAGRCPTCGQVVVAGSEAKHTLLVEERKWLSIIEEAETSTLSTDLAKAEGRCSSLSSVLDGMQAKYDAALGDLSVHERDFAELTKQIALSTERIKQLDEQANVYREQYRDLTKRLKDAEAKIEQLQERQAKRLRTLERTKYWVQGFRDLRLTLVQTALEELELTTNAMLPLFGLDGWEIYYDVTRETKKGALRPELTVTVLSPQNDVAVPWKSWSGGESQRLRVVGALALSEVLLGRAGIDTDCEMLDEPTYRMTSRGARDVVSYLAERARALGRTIWYTDHLVVPSSMFASTVTIVKTKSGSQVEEGRHDGLC